jgi:hypothetical protein
MRLTSPAPGLISVCGPGAAASSPGAVAVVAAKARGHLLLSVPASWRSRGSPGLLADLAAAGVPVLGDLRELWISAGGHLLCRDGRPDSQSGGPAYQPSRAHLEGQVRRRVRALANVTVTDRCAVAGLVTTPARDRITGARVRAWPRQMASLSCNLFDVNQPITP